MSPRQAAKTGPEVRPLPRTTAVPAEGADRLPWERLDGETGAAFDGFLTYRELGYQRTLRKAAMAHYEIPSSEFDPQGTHNGKLRTMERWSSQNQWVRRCEEYDAHVQRIADAEDLHTITEMRSRHAITARIAQTKVLEFLRSMDPKKMTMSQAMQAYEIAVRIERTSLGAPDQVFQLTGAGGGALEVTDVTPEVLESKLRAWLESRDSQNAIEAGEPDGPDKVIVGDEDILPTDVPVAPNTATEWPTAPAPDDGLAWGGDPFPQTGTDEDEDDDE